jgi:sentrin-specific protease 1
LILFYSSTSYSPDFNKKFVAPTATAVVTPNNDEKRKRTSKPSTPLNTTNKRFLEQLNQEQQQRINSVIYPGIGSKEDTLFKQGLDLVRRKSMHSLRPAKWLNDEIIHYYYNMLSKRDEEMFQKDSTCRRSHFFKSFFMTKLLNEESDTNRGQYEYKNVKRWSKKVPGKNIFKLDKLFVPININRSHWVLAEISMLEKKIEIFDSKKHIDGDGGKTYVDALFSYLKDDHLDKYNNPLPDIEEWKLVCSKWTTPQQDKDNRTYNKYI